MAKRKFKNKLISRNEIKEELRLIKNSLTDYITPTGVVYKDYGNGLFFPKKNFINKHNGYVYTGITYPNGNKQRRVHILVIKIFGSCRMCAKELGITVRTITLQCRNHTPTRKPYYFRFLKDTTLDKEYVC